MREQKGFNYRQTADGQQVIQRKSLVPKGATLGTYINTDVPHTNAPQGREDDIYPTRLSTSTRRYQPGIYGEPTQIEKHGNRTYVGHKGQVPPKHFYPQQPPANTNTPTPQPAVKLKKGTTRRIHFHPLVWLGMGMIVMWLLWVALTNLTAFGQQTLDTWHYGLPRTFHVDAVVGHGDTSQNPTHFIAVNLNRHIVVIEIPGGDASKARIYPITTLFGDGQELTPVTLTFKDVNADGKPDMLIHIQDQTIAFINDNGEFRPQKPSEKIHL